MILIISLLMAVTGCDRKPKESQPATKTKTITVTDTAGRKVAIPAKVNRIACLCPFAGYTLAMMGQGGKIVAVVGGLKRDKLLVDMYPNIEQAGVPKVSGGINVEELVRSDPDIVLVKNDTLGNEGEVEKLKKTGIPYLVVDFNNMKQQRYAVELLGKVVNEPQKAKAYDEYYLSSIERVSQRVSAIPEKDRVRLYHSVNEATRTDTRGDFCADWTTVAGAVNVSVQQPLRLYEGKYYAGLEQILMWDPEMIICNEAGVANYILTSKQLSALKAVKTKQVYQLPSAVSRWGHPSSMETPLAILWTAKLMYPEQMKDIDMAKETKYFYKTFFNYDLNDQVVQQILAGQGMRATRSGQKAVSGVN